VGRPSICVRGVHDVESETSNGYGNNNGTSSSSGFNGNGTAYNNNNGAAGTNGYSGSNASKSTFGNTSSSGV
jgi:hypothetical protein